MKRFLRIGLVMLMVVALIGCSQASGSEQKDMNLKISVTVSEHDTWAVAAKQWAEDVEEQTDGRIKMKIYANESLSNGNSPKGLEAVQNGSTEISIHSTIIYSVLDNKFSVPSLPWLLPNYEQAEKAMNGEGGKELMELIRSKGIEPLAFGESGYRQITNSKKPITSPEDLKGLKIRTPSMEMMVDTYREFGGDPTVMNFAEVFTSLQQGVIDGQENPLPIILNSKLAEVQDYLTVWNYMYDPLVFGMNKKLFDGLDEETQNILRETAQEAAKYQIEINRQQNEEILKELEAAGMEIVELTPEQIAAFQKAVQPVISKYEDLVGKDLLDLFRD
ncbi:DctP family TRAP transporter solute-binding subunit [Sutcliffiella rhizosphaerae]|uniref:2,3-diketo-L-gulonate-binding periplasmic protein YiaO n=1 Tax=Sutcliffiella rhizosphaerae TaxID=2880967 RepID=A0ABN8AGW7_9BACI|nr:DctP family TRAP transporter solute-binding subunit [Sutcliffiella rhizosphaerae]CAG9622732.1 2,3-diketo-L-gulonate-binding periplasmic protein YiaO [Sutcliffiella rhizosphaerae]